jgi:2,5-dihydroxypyridine 5,6-dioxygenase
VNLSGVNGNVIMSGCGDDNRDDERGEAVKDHTKSEGGKEAEMFRRVIEDDLDNVCQLREIGVGHNPKVPTFRGERGYHGANHAGAVHWGFGGGHQKKRIHVDAIIFQTTVRANETVIIERGRLKALDDPEVRQLAGKYGEPDRVLSEAL